MDRPGTTESGSIGASASPVRPSLFFVFDGPEPVVTTQLVQLDDLYVNPGAVIEAQGELHMFANAFSHWPGTVRVPHLVSADGVKWALAQPAPALTSDEVPFAEPGADVSSGFVTDDGTWVLIFQSVNLVKPWAIGRATAPGPDGPWTVDPEPILSPGPNGSWDGGALAWPSVVRTKDGWVMYYTASERIGGPGVIGAATSPDGERWTKLGRPVMTAKQPWERGSLDRPRVVVTPRGLAMVYAGHQLTDRGLAWSIDGISWQRDGDRPVITQDDFPGEGRAWDAALAFRSGALVYYLEIGFEGSAGTRIYRATAQIPEAASQ